MSFSHLSTDDSKSLTWSSNLQKGNVTSFALVANSSALGDSWSGLHWYADSCPCNIQAGMNCANNIDNILTERPKVGVEIMLDMTWSASVNHQSEVWRH